MTPIDVYNEVRRVLNGSATAVFLDVSDAGDKNRVVGIAHYWANKSGVGIKTKWQKNCGFVEIRAL